MKKNNKVEKKVKTLIGFGLVAIGFYFLFYFWYWVSKTFTKFLTILFGIFKVKFPFAVNKYLQLFIFLFSFGSFCFLTNNNDYLKQKFNIDDSILMIISYTFLLFYFSLLEIALRSKYLTNYFNDERKWCD
ncbi:MAG: hypothetical protein CMP71_04015 [Flavobacteriales bacterium]|nr:hypothetical protein [Flavobacteriales bacterium]|tara:strand:+ start:667 stop:1059 length:393 start_codon:yes stop_codon:yes gene_type:complete